MLTEASAYEIVVDASFVSSFCCTLCNVKTISCVNNIVTIVELAVTLQLVSHES